MHSNINGVYVLFRPKPCKKCTAIFTVYMCFSVQNHARNTQQYLRCICAFPYKTLREMHRNIYGVLMLFRTKPCEKCTAIFTVQLCFSVQNLARNAQQYLRCSCAFPYKNLRGMHRNIYGVYMCFSVQNLARNAHEYLRCIDVRFPYKTLR